MKKLSLLAIFLLFSVSSFSQTPVCHSTNGGYCTYEGKVQKIYVNSNGIILVYFENNIDPAIATAAGLTITNGSAAAFNMNGNVEIGKLFYSTALTAQVTDRKISISMENVESGYLAFDRIWLK